MTMHRKIQTADGQERDGIVVDFEPERENFSTYLLADGTTLKIKAVLTEVVRVEGVYLPNGDPVYAIQAAQIVSSLPPEQLRRKP